jgi:hypothetical protein
MLEKQVLTSALTAFGTNRSIPFEPAIRFIKATKQAGFLAKTGNPAEQRDLFRKAASNFRLTDRNLRYELQKPWQLVVNQRFWDASEIAAPTTGAARSSEIDLFAQKRRGRDSNPRTGLSPLQHFQCCSFGHSDTSPVDRSGDRRKGRYYTRGVGVSSAANGIRFPSPV